MPKIDFKRKAAAALLIISADSDYENDSPPKKERSIWTHDWLIKRSSEGAHQKLLKEYRDNEDQKHIYGKFLRMDENTFEELLALVSPLIVKQDTPFRASISPSERLSVTLRFLATGDSYKSLSQLFRIAPNTITYIVPEVCDALYEVLKPNYMKVCFSLSCLSCLFFAFPLHVRNILHSLYCRCLQPKRMVIGC